MPDAVRPMSNATSRRFPCDQTNRPDPPPRTRAARQRAQSAGVGRRLDVAACSPLPFNESTASAGPDTPRLPANSTRNRRASTRRRRVLAPCRSTNRRHPPARTLHACPRTPPATVGRRLDVAACLPPAVQRIDGIRRPGRSTPARELRPQPSDANSSSPRACPLPFNESTASAGPDTPRLPASSARNPTRPVACRSDPQNRSSPRRHGVERRPPASRVPPTAPLARRASRAARAPARRARSGKPPPRNRAHRVDQRARDG
ncbi:Uncharacterised protein [Burkholderia pseudomallei]|nr:Uncharacterised protein [Burkholderia pseudomallei]CAJ7108646.1 Uncharacterised protein [Burkholderia pseudomallei]CAJ8428919.1 Uncharacterised protein [Burkholderia pseudomallei]